MQESHRSMKIPRVHNTHRMVQSVLANIMALGGRSDGHIVDDDLYIMRCCVESSPGTHKECFYRERFSGSCQGTASNCGTIYYCGNCLVLWTFFHSLTTDHKETWQRGSQIHFIDLDTQYIYFRGKIKIFRFAFSFVPPIFGIRDGMRHASTFFYKKLQCSIYWLTQKAL